MINIEKSENGKFYFTINSRNGKVLSESKPYSSKQATKTGITSLLKAFSKKPKIVDNTNLK